jgi:photosystem II stability/assembly factor-like uncharacterized protein
MLGLIRRTVLGPRRRKLPRGVVITAWVSAAVVAACGSGSVLGPTPCPPGTAAGTVTVAQALASEAEIVACPVTPIDPSDSCFGGTAWSVGDHLFATAAHIIKDGGLGPMSTTVLRTYVEVTQGAPSFVDGRVLPNAQVATLNVASSDLALISTPSLNLPPLPIGTKNVSAGETAIDVCDQNTIDNLSPPPIANVFTGTTTAVDSSGIGTNAGPPTVFSVTYPRSGPGAPEGCSGSPVLVNGQVAGVAFAAARGDGRSGGGDQSVIPTLAVRSVLHLGTTTSAACGGSHPAPLLSSLHAVPTGDLPSGGGVYNDATCPWSTTCLVVGTSGTRGVLTRSTTSGVSWSTTQVGDASALNAVACPSLNVCFVGGTAGADNHPAVFVTHDSGATWSEQVVPPSVYVDSIACHSGTVTSCIAVGTSSTNKLTSGVAVSTVMSTTDAGATWTAETPPASGLTTIRCFDGTHCWAAGPGAWFTIDLGRTWQNLSPPDPNTGCPTTTGFGVCDGPVWNETIDIEFQTATNGWMVGGQQCAGKDATGCPGAVFHTTDGGTTWTLWPGSTKYPLAWQVACRGASCLYVADTFTNAEVLGTTDGTTWSVLKTIPTVISSLACPPAGSFCVLAGGLQSKPALYVLQAG